MRETIGKALRLEQESYRGLRIRFVKISYEGREDWTLAAAKVDEYIVEGTGRTKEEAFRNIKKNIDSYIKWRGS